MLQVTCLGGLPAQLKSLLFMVQLKLPCVVKQAVMEQVCHLPTPISSPVQTVMGSPAGPFQSLSSHGPFSVAANSSGASYQQSVQSDPQGMGGGIAMGRALGTAPGHLHADCSFSSSRTTLLACLLTHLFFHSLLPALNNSFACGLTYSRTDSLLHAACSLAHALACFLEHLPMKSLACLLSRPLVHWLCHLGIRYLASAHFIGSQNA